ncbi:hypothetical protein [Vibrio comitans]|uniref:Chromosome partitioning protein ParA n=1 Tax=Vibrio comitans NBRC 102076 TaxID=1219078 RepID=A0A4Y3IQY4_9VIBR|nr:hypothetical protein [Vibrio comitans]GEA61597.1 hypothetical protein VCO01S_27900 [Vibrio comitans NBRC 102076]
MQFKKTSLATAVIVSIALAGCGSDSNSGNEPTDPPNPPEASQGVFIDAAVEGLYYVSEPSGKSGFTDAQGFFEHQDGDLVTFFLGGEEGLRIGKVSARGVVSPFEATGNYQKALNLARILQSAGSTTQEAITLPDSLIAPDSKMLAALHNVLLHDMGSANDLQLALEVEEWVTEDDALEHLNNSLDAWERGSKEVLKDWSRGSNKILREVGSSLSASNPSDVLFVHADKLLDEELFNATLGMKTMTYQLGESELTILSGSNDTTISGDRAASYLACIDAEGIDAEFDGGQVPALCNGQVVTNTKFVLGSAFEYSILDPNETEENGDESWDEVTNFGGMWACLAAGTCSENTLTQLDIVQYDDSDDQDGSHMQRDILSGSYDSVTGIYTEVKNREILSGQYEGRQSESISFTYLIDSADSERYVDFIGTWHASATRDGCDGIAVSTYVFDKQGLTVTGNEFTGDCEIEEINEEETYAELAEMDYWWFTTNESGNSKATLAQLNSTVRWCDSENVGDVCAVQEQKINRWEYVPAGANWDQGTLNRRTLDSNGAVTSTVSMYKK